MNIDEMQAGRELDALVAEKVMGWRFWQEPFKDSGKLGWVSASPSGQEFFHDEKTGFPEYSTSIAAAWQVLEKIGTMGEKIFVRFTEDLSGLDLLIGQNAKDASLSICLAALKAVGA